MRHGPQRVSWGLFVMRRPHSRADHDAVRRFRWLVPALTFDERGRHSAGAQRHHTIAHAIALLGLLREPDGGLA